MPLRRLLIANRGEIAQRIERSALEQGWQVVRVHAADEAAPRVPAGVDAAQWQCQALRGQGVQAYLDVADWVRVAHATACTAVHPGYGFVSEQADAAHALQGAGVAWVGPSPAQLQALGDKAQARQLAVAQGVPVLAASQAGRGDTGLQAAHALWAQHPQGLMLKAVAGGGGRGMRRVRVAAELANAWASAAREAQAAFDDDRLYAESLFTHARHIEVQLIGDGQTVQVLGDRDCSLQRRHQKLIERAPAAHLSAATRHALHAAARRMAQALQLRSLCTFEFMVALDAAAPQPWVFIEANARLQVEHTVTEAITGLDLVALQLALAHGATLADLGLADAPPTERGSAVQLRIATEVPQADGSVHPASGEVQALQWPTGAGVRIDTALALGQALDGRFDPLVAKLVVHASDSATLATRTRVALQGCAVQGVATNLVLLQGLWDDPAVAQGQALATEWLGERWATVVAGMAQRMPPQDLLSSPVDDDCVLRSPTTGRVVAIECASGAVAAGTLLLVVEALKMHHELRAPQALYLQHIQVALGDNVQAGQALLQVQPLSATSVDAAGPATAASDAVRPELQRLRDRLALLSDEARPEALARRQREGSRTARQNIADLCETDQPDALTAGAHFTEYGGLAYAAQTQRRPVDELIRATPADGMVTGMGTVNVRQVGPERAATVVMAYDATVLAGTQGMRNHQKTDRLLQIAHQQRLPVVLFAEGGGGRPGDVDMPIVAGLHVPTFAGFASLRGVVPVVGVAHGRCFAGNAALLGCSDVVIATHSARIGMGGPAMIEGGGLGLVAADAIGPAAQGYANGVVDVLVADEAAATAAARQVLGLFQGHWPAGAAAPDTGALRQVVPANRLRVYDSRAAVLGLCDTASVLWLGDSERGAGRGIHTALARIDGHPVGVLANNPVHLSGAIDPDGAAKAARFIALCKRHGLPIVSLIDTPGFMVGPEVEARAQVRHACDLFVAAAAPGRHGQPAPWFSIVLRKGYGLGAMAMAAGGFHSSAFTIAWPTGEFGAMGLEGAVRLGYKKELQALPEGAEREALFQQLLSRQVDAGQALNMAATLEIDAVIDPADTRAWVLRGLQAAAKS